MGCADTKHIEMGCAGTKQRHPREYVFPFHLSSGTNFTVKEVEALHELFRKLSSSIVDDGFISKMFQLFDSNNDGLLDFAEFVRSLSIFHPGTPQADKADFAFRLYDIWHTGFIQREDVMHMILALLDESDLILSDDTVEAIINKTFDEADSKGDGKIDMEEWKGFGDRNPSVLKNMTIPYLRDITTAFPSFVQRSETEDEMNKFLRRKPSTKTA